MITILFSPVGSTDPITNFHDGSLLHICRKYKPEKVYLYLSKEMLAFHEQDDRYCRCLNWLQEKEGFHCDIEIIARPDLVDVQYFDYFYDEFEQEVKKIYQEYPEATILFNVSSGTPAMKSALQFLAATSENMYVPVQVSTPQKGANRERHEFEKYDVELSWELNEDNQEPFEDRCIESETAMLMKRIKLEVIRKHIEAYDYQAALRVAQSIEKLLSPELLFLLEGAVKRYMLDIKGANEAFRKAGQTVLPAISSDKQFVLEYLLWLQIKQKRNELVDFVRGLSPVFVDIFLLALKEKYKIDFLQYCPKNSKRVPKLRRTVLQEKNPELFEYLDKELNGGVQDKDLNSTMLLFAFKKECKDEAIVRMAKHLRAIEESARNVAAHEIVSVTEDWLKQITADEKEERPGYDSAKIMKLLKEFTMKTCSGIKPALWNSYEEMNLLLIAALK